ncbi:hypothetical protein ACR746_10470 [Cutibacterium avidum]
MLQQYAVRCGGASLTGWG